MKKYLNISLVIPYHNEKQEVLKTLKNVLSKKSIPKEILLVDSSSTDKSFEVVNKFIKEFKNKNIIIKNITKGTKFPSTSKNLGIKFSKYNLVSFIDCGIKLKNNWLFDQYNLLNKKQVDCVFGACYFNPKDALNISIILNTYGYKTTHSVIPSSLFKKKIFKKAGYFPKKRAGYDWFWISNIKKSNIKFYNTKKVTIEYQKFVNKLHELPSKIFLYSFHSYEFQPFLKKFLYVLVPIYLIISTKILLLNCYIYYLARFIFVMNKSISPLKIINLKIIFYQILIMPLIDISRCIGFYYYYIRSKKNDSK
jgi:glycosyltransferase involved in cell wall biosynthesis